MDIEFCPFSYDYKTEPYKHQFKWLMENAHLPSRALFWTMRTGKTKTMIDNAFFLSEIKQIDCVIIVAPNGVNSNWINRELPTHGWHENYNSLYWVASICSNANKHKPQHAHWWGKLKTAVNDDKLMFIAFNMQSLVNIEVKNIIKKLVSKKQTMLIIDESHHFGKPSSKRTKFAISFSKKCKYKRILTGTPVTENPLNLYSQIKILDDRINKFWANYEEFTAYFAEYVRVNTADGRSFTKLKSYKNLDDLKKLIDKYASVIKREEIPNLPELNKEIIKVEPSDKQKEIYSKFLSETFIEIQEGIIDKSLTKLQQVLSGFILDSESNIHIISGENPKLNKLIEEIQKLKKSVIVFATFRQDFTTISKKLKEKKISYLTYYGSTDEANREKFKAEFSKQTKCKVALCNPHSVGEGLNLSACDTIIWYSHTFKAVTHEQANERATALHKNEIQIKYLSCGGVDDYILDTLNKKIDLEKALLSSDFNDTITRLSDI